MIRYQIAIDLFDWNAYNSEVINSQIKSETDRTGLAGSVSWKIQQGDWIEVLSTMPDESVNCVVTSPPYWGLRDYGVPGQLGLERTPEEYVAKMVEGFREVRRVLRSDGTLWMNLGDSYCGSATGADSSSSTLQGGKTTQRESLKRPSKLGVGLKPKDLVGIPWMVAFALRSDGWYLRQDIIWAKPNPMPESVTDRCTKSHEYLFLLTKSERYFCDMAAIAEPLAGSTVLRYAQSTPMTISGQFKGSPTDKRYQDEGKKINGCDLPTSRNKRSVWELATQPYSEAHFATFPPKLVEPCILAGTSKRCCPHCGAPAVIVSNGHRGEWDKSCTCWNPITEAPAKCTVLDPFSGAGTTGLVATRLGRNFVGIELNPDYVAMSKRRITADAPLFNTLGAE